MVSKVLKLAAVAGLVAVFVQYWPDMRRYLKIRQM